MRDHDVSGLADGDLGRIRRELSASLALARPGSLARAPIETQLHAVEAELAARAVLRVCSCGMATDDDARMDGHLFEHPGHNERDLSRYQDCAIVVVDRR
jgi:hypothetical protein